MNSVEIVHAFWNEVWNANDPSAVDRFVIDDFVIVSGGETIFGRENFKEWVAGFLAKVNDLHLEVIESFQNDDGSRVASRWLLTGKNNGFLGTEPDQQDIAMTGTAVWAVNGDGKLLTNWVERASWELFQRLTGAGQ
jgi:ketosteroid isomerase-like protein